MKKGFLLSRSAVSPQQSIYNGKNNGRYTTQQTQWQIHGSRYTVADTKWWIYRGKYTAVDIQRQIQQWIYNTADSG
jgi:hypothetical protein